MELLLKVSGGTSLLFIFLDVSQEEQELSLAHLGLFLLECSLALALCYFKTNSIKNRRVKLSLVGLRTPCPDSSLDAESHKGGDKSVENAFGRLCSLPPLPGLNPWRPPA